MMLAVYNAWDNVRRRTDACTQLDLLPFYVMKTAYHNSTLHNSHSNMMLVEDMMGHLLMGSRASSLPSVQRSSPTHMPEGGIEQGGFVMDAPTGMCGGTHLNWTTPWNTHQRHHHWELRSRHQGRPRGLPRRVPLPDDTVTRGGRVYRRDKVPSIMATCPSQTSPPPGRHIKDADADRGRTPSDLCFYWTGNSES